jgi:non-heme chloroperoxidase
MKIRLLALSCFGTAACLAQISANPGIEQSAVWHDPSPHRVQMVTVDAGVQSEVLDWGGTGRPVVLLAGLGNTAHVFDDFAPKLTPEYHVYAITRRGFGISSVPTSGYTADRLGDDVLAVLDALKIERPVLAGHSIAGEELSSVATRRPERIAGLIYLDAANSYAYYDRSRGDWTIDLAELLKKLSRLQSRPGSTKQLVEELLQNDLPGFERDLRELQKNLQSTAPTQLPASFAPTAADRATFTAFRSWQSRVQGVTMPEAELRQVFESTPEGHVGKQHPSPVVPQAIWAGEQKYTDIGVPALALFALPHDLGPAANLDPVAHAAAEAMDIANTGAQARAFEAGVPSARVVRIPKANHFLFLSNEADVLHEMRAFLDGLK